jgi:hypothetical protein
MRREPVSDGGSGDARANDDAIGLLRHARILNPFLH